MNIKNSGIPHTSLPSFVSSTFCIPYPCHLPWLPRTIPLSPLNAPRAGNMLVLPKNHVLQNTQKLTKLPLMLHKITR
jgi:hypothetical protein